MPLRLVSAPQNDPQSCVRRSHEEVHNKSPQPEQEQSLPRQAQGEASSRTPTRDGRLAPNVPLSSVLSFALARFRARS